MGPGAGGGIAFFKALEPDQELVRELLGPEGVGRPRHGLVQRERAQVAIAKFRRDMTQDIAAPVIVLKRLAAQGARLVRVRDESEIGQGTVLAGGGQDLRGMKTDRHFV